MAGGTRYGTMPTRPRRRSAGVSEPASATRTLTHRTRAMPNRCTTGSSARSFRPSTTGMPRACPVPGWPRSASRWRAWPRRGACTGWCTTTSSRSTFQGRAPRAGPRARAGGGARARDLASALERLRDGWPAIRVAVEDVTVAPGGAMRAEIVADLGLLEPSDVTVQLWVAPSLRAAHPLAARFEERRDGVARYSAQVPQETGTDAELVARVLPCHPALAGMCVPDLITWSD